VALAILAPLNGTVDLVDNGLEAVQAVMRKPYDIILMDIQMPEMNGPEATRKIRNLPGPISKIPIIALTAHAMKGDRGKYLALGMNDYISKPVDPNLLFSAIASCVSGKVSAPYSDDGTKFGNQSSDDVDFGELVSELDALVDGINRDVALSRAAS
jgi:CheY-like chemotaxis protein